MSSQNLFVYGTLMSRYRDPRDGEIKKAPRSEILKDINFEKALLHDYKLVWPNQLNFPFIIHFKGHSVKGEVYYAIGEEVIKVLDEIEGIAEGLYKKKIVNVIIENGDKIEVIVYVGGEQLQRYRDSPSYFTVIPEDFKKLESNNL
ncbi:MAG: gamma-glutamylcyclotransferase family protein [Candidatus Jordarchaeum sp.]|uniref:gamma-glutamylcyclotransferase family protein n=1 Tax=Candidatus Jordarchaeum sp. TaxID=2823881 RepID=UPI004048F676